MVMGSIPIVALLFVGFVLRSGCVRVGVCWVLLRVVVFHTIFVKGRLV